MIDQVEYKIYDQNDYEIDLSVCQDVEISIEYKIKDTSLINLQEALSFQDIGVDVFNLKDDFFNDICYSFSDSNSSSDMILSDRVSDIFQNVSLCGDGCEYQSINYETNSANCKCEVKKEINTKPEKGNFQSSIMNTFLESNFGVIKCFNLVFSFEGKLSNIGFWVFGSILLFHIPIYIFYFKNGTTKMKNFISKEMIKKGYIPNEEEPPKNIEPLTYQRKSGKHNTFEIRDNNKDNNKDYIKTDYMQTIETFYNNDNPTTKDNNNNAYFNGRDSQGDIFIKSNDVKSFKKKIKIKKKMKIKIKIKKSKFRKTENYDNINLDTNEKKDEKDIDVKIHIENVNVNERNGRNYKSNVVSVFSKQNTNICETKEEISHSSNKIKLKPKKSSKYLLILINANNEESPIPYQSDYILDNFDYKQAIIYEDRTYCRIFFIFLIAKENVLNMFFFDPPLELKPIRFAIFIFNFACDFALNALFYLSDNISDQYHYEGLYKELFAIINNLSISLSSAIVSSVLLFFFKHLTQSTDKIENLFREQENLLKKDIEYKVKNESKIEIINKIKDIINCLRIKIIFFIVLEFLFMFFFFYYATSFCQVYKNTQISWILDCIVSYVISLGITLASSVVFALIYKIAVKYKKKFFYELVKFLYLI